MITVISTVSVFVLSSTLFFIMGVFCARVLCRSKQDNQNPVNNQDQREDRIYTSVLPSAKLVHDLNFDLKENSAYESVIVT
jgi:hypothetical protein